MDQLKAAPQPENRLHFLDYWRIIRIRKTVILAVFFLVVITATVVTFFLPEKFASTARIKIERDQSDISGVLQAAPVMSGYDPYFIQTEFEVIQSEVVLGKVVQKLNLTKNWSANKEKPIQTSEAIDILKRIMDLRPVRNTSLIEIRVVWSDPKQAAEYANAIAEAYKEHRLEQRTGQTQGGIDAIAKRLEGQEKKVAEAQKRVADLREKLKIPDAIASENAPSMLMTAETLRQIERERITSQGEYVRQKTLLEELQKLSPDELVEALPLATQDLLLSSRMEQLTLAQQNLVTAKSQYGPEHSEVQKASAQVEALRQKVNDRVKGLMQSLQVKVTSLAKGLENMQEEVDKATQTDIDKANSSRPYFEAKQELEEQQGLRRILSLKVYQEETDLKLPKTSMVEIVDYAKPKMIPVKPNKPVNIALGVIIGLIVGIGLAFFIEYLDTSVKTIDDVERALGSPVLGVIPQNVGLIVEEGADSPHAEAYRVLRTNLLFSRKDDNLNSVAVVSAGAGEGKSTTVFNLASVFAQSGQRVLIVDSDLRRPRLHKMFGVTNNIGLTNYLLKQNKLEEVIQTTKIPSMDFMASGKLPSSSLGILSSSQMRELINELKQHYDFVFFDSPPVMGVSDASVLASEVDMTLMVIQYRRYPQPMNIRAKQLIEKVGGNLAGIVLNNINMSQDESYYYYSGYYHDYYAKSEDQEPGVAPAGESDGKGKLEIKKKY